MVKCHSRYFRLFNKTLFLTLSLSSLSYTHTHTPPTPQNKLILTYRIETKPNQIIEKEDWVGKGNGDYYEELSLFTFIPLIRVSVDGSQSKEGKDNKSQ